MVTPLVAFFQEERKRELVAGLFVASLAFLVYANSLGNGLVWDDAVVIRENQALREGIAPLFGGIDTARNIELTPYYRPLTLLTFLIEERLHGLTPLPMHLVNLLLHAVNAFLVYRLTRLLTRRNDAAALAGILFAVHPINTEAVNFVSGGRNTLLAGLFVMMAYLLHRRSVVEKKTSWAVAGAAFFLAGLFSKESALAILPFIVALQIRPLLSGTPGQRLKSVGNLVPYLSGAAGYFILRSIALSRAGVEIEILPGLGTRLLNNLYIIPRYLLTVMWPASVSSMYVVPDDLHLLALPLAVAWLTIAGALLWLLTLGRSRAALFGLLWLMAFLLPVIGIIPIPSAAMADRYFYLPVIGLWIIIADRSVQLFRSGTENRKYSTIAAIVVLLVLAGMTAARNLDWKSDITLFSRYIEQYPERAFGYHNLGCAYLDTVRDIDAAEKAFQRASSIDPSFPRLQTQMGYVRLLRGDYAGAVHHYDEAIFQNPFDAEAYLNRAMALERLGSYEEAVADYKRFLAMPGGELAKARPQAAERVRELSK